MDARSARPMLSTEPRMGRPSGCPAKARAPAISNTWSSGVSKASAISCATTSFSRITSAALSVGRKTMSESTCMAMGREDSMARTSKLVRSWPVAALMEPPSASMRWTMSRALMSPAPLNTRCSSRCDQPERCSSSQRAPPRTATVRAKVLRPGMGSATTRTPLGRVCKGVTLCPGPFRRRVAGPAAAAASASGRRRPPGRRRGRTR